MFPTEWINYGLSFFLFVMGLAIIILDMNLMRKLIGLALFQSSNILFFITLSKIPKGHIPIFNEKIISTETYTNPLPHVLMLTAIVVGVSSLAVGLALIIRIQGNCK